MDLTAWFGSQGVFSTGDAAHIFGSGSVPQQLRLPDRPLDLILPPQREAMAMRLTGLPHFSAKLFRT